MNVYFVRHAESKGNIRGTQDSSSSPLTPEGKKQTFQVAARFSTIPIDEAFSSDYVRASSTARAIEQVIGIRVKHSDMLRELKPPSEMIGLKYNQQKAKKIKRLIYENRHDPLWHYSDEENFFDLKNRAQSFIRFLSRRRKKNILVVTHGLMLRMIVGTMIFEDQLTPDLFWAMFMKIRTRNTGITLCKKTKWGWKLEVWNDHAHLG